MAEKKRFKLTFRQISVDGPGFTQQRALIIAVAASPVKGWMQTVLACESGMMMQKMISTLQFEASARAEVTMIEAEGELAPPVLYEVTPAGSTG